MSLPIRFLLIIVLCIWSNSLLSQERKATHLRQFKPIIDSDAISRWVTVSKQRSVSNNGQFFMYVLENKSLSSRRIVIQSTVDQWRKEFYGVGSGMFSSDSKRFIFLTHDTLTFVHLGTDSCTRVSKVSGYEKPKNIEANWVAYQLKDARKELVIYNLLNAQERRFENIQDYKFDNSGNTLLFKRVVPGKEQEVTSLESINLTSGVKNTIWSSKDYSRGKILDFNISNDGSQIVFMLEKKELSLTEYSLWYYKQGGQAVEKINNATSGIHPRFAISISGFEFSEDGRYIFFHLEPTGQSTTSKVEKSSLDVWNYKDEVTQDIQLLQMNDKARFDAVVSTNAESFIQLTRNRESIVAKTGTSNFAVVAHEEKPEYKNQSRLKSQIKYYLVSLKDGSRRQIPTLGKSEFWFSPAGRYLFYYDWVTKQYNSYNLSSGSFKEVSTSIPKGWLSYSSKFYKSDPVNFPVAPVLGGVTGCWLENDSAAWVYDNYDIWQLDLAGKKPPINITNGYGRLNRIELRLLTQSRDNRVISIKRDSLVLVAFNTENKDNGFYKLITGSTGNPELLVMGPWTFYHLGFSNLELDEGQKPLKACKSDVWVVLRQSAIEAPNYFLTRDFKVFRPLTNLDQEKKYNWIQAELIRWRQLDGTFTQGVLYKPENFDSNRKYPVLFNYYNQLSQRLNEFAEPGFSRSADINIPWLVSRGYIVLTPDIYYRSGLMYKDAITNTVISAANYLSKLSYVDSKKMAIAGHSNGGSQTNYLVTHSDKFSACLSSASTGDMVSTAFQLSSFPNMIEEIELRMGGATLWEHPELYIDASAVYNANKVNTPILLLINKGDINVWPGGFEFFSALRRLNKKAWLLQYDNGDHKLDFKKDPEDYTIRATQFLDHYLKSAPAPLWMTKGIPARLKQVITGYDLDPANSCGKDCKVCKQWNEKFKKDSAACWKEIEEKTKSEHWMGGEENK